MPRMSRGIVLGSPRTIQVGPQKLSNELFQSLTRPARPAYGVEGGIAALGQPMANALLANVEQAREDERMAAAEAKKQQQQQMQASALGRMLQAAAKARQAGQSPAAALTQAGQAAPPGAAPAVAGAYSSALAQTLKPQKSAQGFTLSPGQQRFGPGGQPIASVGPKSRLLTPEEEAQQARLNRARRNQTTINTGGFKALTKPAKLRSDRENLIARGASEDSPSVKAIDRELAKVGAPTGEQAKSGGFADRMTISNRNLENLEGEGGSVFGRLKEKFGAAGNYLQSPEYQQFLQARDDFINAQLRKESGAAIGPIEYERADRQYFPQPGDSPEVIAQKRANRNAAVNAMVRGAGDGYKPPPPPKYPEGTRIVNPTTGEVRVMTNGEWKAQ